MYKDKKDISFSLVTQGWLVCNLNFSEIQLTLAHSYDYGDMLPILLDAVNIICKPSIQDSEDQIMVLWCDEQMQFKWKFERIKNMVNINIHTLSLALPKNEKKILENYELEAFELITLVYNAMKRFYQEVGFSGYKKLWEIANFPIAQMLELHILAHKIYIDEINLFEEDTEEFYTRLPIEIETQFIQSWNL